MTEILFAMSTSSVDKQKEGGNASLEQLAIDIASIKKTMDDPEIPPLERIVVSMTLAQLAIDIAAAEKEAGLQPSETSALIHALEASRPPASRK